MLRGNSTAGTKERVSRAIQESVGRLRGFVVHGL